MGERVRKRMGERERIQLLYRFGQKHGEAGPSDSSLLRCSGFMSHVMPERLPSPGRRVRGGGAVWGGKGRGGERRGSRRGRRGRREKGLSSFLGGWC